MGYDVTVGDYDFNYTSNVSQLFYDHIDGGLSALNGLTGRQAALIIGESFERLNRTRHKVWKNNNVGDPVFCAKYDAPNGWGSTVGAIVFLGEIMNACIRHPRAIVWVSC